MAYLGRSPARVPVTAADIPDNSITAAKIVDGAITIADIADDAVTVDKLANSINTTIAANTAKTGITSGQASAITANTAKVTNSTNASDLASGTVAAARLDTATTQAESNDSTKIATTAYVVDKITTLIGGAPSTLNDLNELAAAINDDDDYNSTLTTALATKLPLAGGTMTGTTAHGTNVKSTYGASADLEIYHNGTDSIIDDNGAGKLVLKGSTAVELRSRSGLDMGVFIEGGASKLYHSGNVKLATTSTGIDISGTNGDIINITTTSGTEAAIWVDGNELSIKVDADNDDVNSIITFDVDAAERLRVKSTGIDVTGTVTADAGSYTTVLAGNSITFDRDGDNNIVADSGSSANLNLTAGKRIFLTADDYQSFKIGSSPTEKLRILSTGIDVTGDYVNSGGLYSDSNSSLKIISGGNASNAGSNLTLYGGTNASAGTFRFRNGTATHLEVAGNGDISFYEDTGSTPKFFWDASAEKLGIGTASPGYKLEIASDTNSTVNLLLLRNSDSTYSQTFGFQLDTNKDLVITGSSGSGGIHFNAGSRGYLFDGGSVSIPSGDLDVTGTVTADGLVVDGGGSRAYLNSTQLRLSDAYNLEWGGGTNYIRGSNASNYVLLATNGTERLRINSSGNILVGHTTSIGQEVCQSGTTVSAWTPNSQVHATGNGGLSVSQWNTGNTASANIWLTKSSNATVGTHGSLAENEAIGRIIFSASDGSTFSNAASIEAFADDGQGSNDTPARLEFKTTADGDTTPTTRMTIDSLGNVGIGTDSPSERLTIYENDSSFGSTTLYVHNDKADDAAILMLEGKRSSTNDTAQIIMANDGNNVAAIKAYSGADEGELRFYTSPTSSGDVVTERLRIDSSGNVGIGLVDPDDVLTIDVNEGSNNVRAIHLVGGPDVTEKYISIGRTHTVSNDHINSEIRFGAETGGSGTAYMAFAVNGNPTATERMRIDSSGNVGIGTTSPSAPLDVVVSSNLWVGEFTQSNTSNGDGLLVSVGSTAAADYALSIRSNAGNTHVLAAKADGKVGIGTASPSAELHIDHGGTENKIKVGGTVNWQVYTHTSVERAVLGTTTNHDMRFTTNNTDRMTILAGGNVGIGTDSPSELLEVYSATSNADFLLKAAAASQDARQFIRRKDNNGRAYLAFQDTDNSYNWYTGLLRGSGNKYAIGTADDFSNAGTKLVIDSSGNVGIGTGSPDSTLHIEKNATGANNQELLKISRVGGSTGDSSRRASISFFDASNSTYTGMISGYRDSPSGNYSGGLRFYVNEHSVNANATFAELDNCPALYLNYDQSATFHKDVSIFGNTFTIDADHGTWVGRYQHLTCHNTLTSSAVWQDVAYVSYSPSLTIQGSGQRDNGGSYGQANFHGTIMGGYGSVYVDTIVSRIVPMSSAGFSTLEYRYLNGGATSGSYRLQVRMAFTAGTMYVTTTLQGHAHAQISED